jgi:RNA polymerase sigma-70 factor (ECF subfamily)
VVDIQAVANLDGLQVEDPGPSPERVVLARAELRWVLGLISNLPDRCKQVFRARKVYGLSQSATAETLGLSENVVEKETMRGMAILSDLIERVGINTGAAAPAGNAGKTASKRKRHVEG